MSTKVGDSAQRTRSRETSADPGVTAPKGPPAEDAPSLDEMCPTPSGAAGADALETSRGAPLDEAMRGIEQAIDRSVSNPVITDAEARTALSHLESLSPADAKTALAKLDDSGLLKTLTKELPDADRGRLLDVATRAGYFEKRSFDAPQAPYAPPAEPDRYTASSKQAPPKALRELAEATYEDAASDYRAAYRGYLDRYEAAASSASSVAELRKMGPPLDAADEPYRGRVRTSTNQARIAVNERMHELTGRTPPGDLSFTFRSKLQAFGNEVEGTVGVSKRGVTGTASGAVGLATKNDDGEIGSVSHKDGVTTIGTGRETTNADGDKESRSAKLGIDGQGTIREGELDAGAGKGSFKRDADGKLTEIGGGIGPAAGKLTSEGYEVEVGATLGKHSKATGFSTGNLQEAEFSGGVRVEAEAGDYVNAELEAALRYAGLSPEDVRLAILNDVGFYDTPPEVQRLVPWEQLPEEVRDTYEKALGWNAQDWNAAVADRRDSIHRPL